MLKSLFTDHALKILAIVASAGIGAIITALWGVISTVQSRKIDARRPFLNLQLSLYQEATKVVAILATSTDQAERQNAENRFWQLYWGELALVENGEAPKISKGKEEEDTIVAGVEGAMVRFGDALKAQPFDQSALPELALDLAYSCRDSLAESWHVKNWKTSDHQIKGPKK